MMYKSRFLLWPVSRLCGKSLTYVCGFFCTAHRFGARLCVTHNATRFSSLPLRSTTQPLCFCLAVVVCVAQTNRLHVIYSGTVGAAREAACKVG